MTYANPPRSGVSDAFVSDFADLARSLRASVPDLSPAEKHQLKDICDDRYKWIVLRSVIHICSRSTQIEHRRRPLVATLLQIRYACRRGAQNQRTHGTPRRLDARHAARARRRSRASTVECALEWNRRTAGVAS